MGIDIRGGMIVGNHRREISLDEDLIEEEFGGYEGDYFESLDMETMSPWYDAGISECFIGYPVPDVPINSVEFESWIEDVKRKGAKFKELTGADPILIGTQDVW